MCVQIMSIVDVEVPALEAGQCDLSGKRRVGDVYIVSELMETDLHRVIHSTQPLSTLHVQFFMYQVCGARWGRIRVYGC